MIALNMAHQWRVRCDVETSIARMLMPVYLSSD